MGETESVERFAQLKDEGIELSMGECAPVMGQNARFVATKDAQIESSKEGCV